MKQIVVFPRGQLTAEDRKHLRRAGVVIVEADDPSKVVTMLPTAPVPTDKVLGLALKALKSSDSVAAFRMFIDGLATLVTEQSAK